MGFVESGDPMNQPHSAHPYGHDDSPYNAPHTDAYGAPSDGSYTMPYAPPQTETFSRPNPWSLWALAMAVIPPVFIIVLTLVVFSAGFLLSVVSMATGLAAVALGGLALIMSQGRRPEHKRRGMAIVAIVVGVGWATAAPLVPMAMMLAFELKP